MLLTVIKVCIIRLCDLSRWPAGWPPPFACWGHSWWGWCLAHGGALSALNKSSDADWTSRVTCSLLVGRELHSHTGRLQWSALPTNELQGGWRRLKWKGTMTFSESQEVRNVQDTLKQMLYATHQLLHILDTANHAGIIHKPLDSYHFSEALHTRAPAGECNLDQWSRQLCWEEWKLPFFWSTAYWSSCRWVTARTMSWSAMARGMKVTFLLEHCILELLQVNDS